MPLLCTNNQGNMASSCNGIHTTADPIPTPYHLLWGSEPVTLFRLYTGLNHLNHHLFTKFKTGQSEHYPIKTSSMTTEHLLQASTTWTTTSLPRLELVNQNTAPLTSAAWQQNICCRHTHYRTTSGVSSGRWRPQWWRRFLEAWTTYSVRQSPCKEPKFASERSTRNTPTARTRI